MVKEGMNFSIHTIADEKGLREREPASLCQNYGSHKLRVRKIVSALTTLEHAPRAWELENGR